jgi:peptide/nickel transport system substrate-binding protein
MVVNFSTAPGTLDPSEECYTADFVVAESVYTRLTRYGQAKGPKGTARSDYSVIEPDFAKSWEITAAGTVYTFHLRSGLTFSDGTPITSTDVAYSFNRDIAMNGCGAYFVLDGFYPPDPLIKSIATPSPLTVVITLNFADPDALSDWAQPAASIVEPGPIAAHGGVVANAVNTWMADHVSGGGGAFNLTSYEPSVEATLTANPGYWQPAKTHRILINFISSAATLALDARDGEADFTFGLPYAEDHVLAKDSSVRIVSDASPESEQLDFNNKVAPTSNRDFREALMYATPYAQILKKVVFGYGSLFYGAFTPPMLGFNAKAEQPLAYDVARAKQLLVKSGIHLPVSLPVDVESGDSASAELVAILESVWSPLGVKVTIHTLSTTDYSNVLADHDFTAVTYLDGPGVPEPAYYLGYDDKCGITDSIDQMCVPELDRLLAQAVKVPVSQEGPYWTKINLLYRADFPKILAYSFSSVAVLGRRVTAYDQAFEFGTLQYWAIR